MVTTMRRLLQNWEVLRFPLVLVSLLTLIIGGCVGLERMGWVIPGWPQAAPLIQHGPLMISGFLGTLIGVERGVALRRPWAYLGPLFSGLGAIVLLAGPSQAAPYLMTVSSLMLVIVFGVIVRQHPAFYTITMALGAVAWLAGNSMWLLGQTVFQVVHWWIAFLILTIAGERLELSRLLRLPGSSRLSFGVVILILLAGLLGSILAPDTGVRVTGVGDVLLAVWLFFYDIAGRTLRQSGLPRYAAVCLLAGYVWLGAGGLIMLVFGVQIAGLLYDAMLHALTVGFIMSMIFGHAPIILPAVLKRPVVYVSALYAPLSLLHLSILLRVVADISSWGIGRKWGGLLNAAAILVFIGIMAYAARHTATSSPQGHVSDSQPGSALQR
jgi:hypothetical protein